MTLQDLDANILQTALMRRCRLVEARQERIGNVFNRQGGVSQHLAVEYNHFDCIHCPPSGQPLFRLRSTGWR